MHLEIWNLNSSFDSKYIVIDWTMMNKNFFSALKMEKTMLMLLMFLMPLMLLKLSVISMIQFF